MTTCTTQLRVKLKKRASQHVAAGQFDGRMISATLCGCTAEVPLDTWQRASLTAGSSVPFYVAAQLRSLSTHGSGPV
eukprot:351323-Chlamydomonas_euryale.AAC.12